MALRDIVGPRSLDQILFVSLLWVVIVVGLGYVQNESIIRVEIVVGTGILLVWVVWGVRYRLEQVRKERYKR